MGFSGSIKLCTLLTSAMCESAWGKLPTSRDAVASYSSDNSPTSLRNDSSRPRRTVAAPEHYVGIDQPEAASEKGSLSCRQPVLTGACIAAQHEAIAQQPLLDRHHGSGNPFVSSRQKPNDRYQQCAGIELFRTESEPT